MVQFGDAHPLAGFLRDHRAHIERLRATGRPEVLTVEGEASVIVQDAKAYERMFDILDELDSERIVRERLASLDRGEPGIPAEQALADIRRRLGLPGRETP